MITIDSLLISVGGYMPPADLLEVRAAYDYALKIHGDDKKRLSGEPYITHPLMVAQTLATMKLDRHTVCAGLLHSVLKGEAPKSSEAELEKLFGPEVARIVSGTTKITNVSFNSRLDYQAENVKKMLLAMSADIRVLLVRLADQLHDMRSLEYLSLERQAEIASETMELYAPLASRIGVDRLKRELEDLAFAYLYPAQFAEISGKMAMSANERESFVERIKEILQEKLRQHNINDCRILGRPKHLYSIYRKLIAQKIPLEKVYDKVAFRIILPTVNECYEALGVVHSLWQPIPSRFKDFIGSPKPNRYQSLHTSVVGPHGDFMEIQLRTMEMDEIANDGIAAHWAYKEGSAISKKDAQLFQWLKQMVQGLQEVSDPQEFLTAVKEELTYNEVYAVTPGGEVKEFPRGSTPLDFAYAVHTEVGNRCVGAKVNGRIVPLKYILKNGDVVEIITSASQHPSQGWLALVKTNRAKSRIRHWLNQEEWEKSLTVGREICDRELHKYDLSLKKIIRTGHLRELLKKFSCNALDDLLRKVGSAKVSTKAIVEALQPPELKVEPPPPPPSALPPPPKAGKEGREFAIRIDGIDDLLVKISNCCMPMPGDDIMGFITAGRGISVHKASCRNFLATDSERWVEVEWAATARVRHRAQIQISAHDKQGLLAAVCNACSADNAHLLDVTAHASTNTNMALINLVVEVDNIDHLHHLLLRLSQMQGVVEARRK